MSDIMARVFADESTEITPHPDIEVAASTFRIETKKFVLDKLLSKVYGAIPTKDVSPLWKNFHISASQGRVVVTGSDGDTSIVCYDTMVMASIPGKAIFPAKRLYELVKALDEGDVILDVAGSEAILESGNASFTIKLQDAKYYSLPPSAKDVRFTQVAKDKFVTALKAVRQAATHDAVKPSLMMVAIENNKMMAADGVTRFQQVTLDEEFASLDLQIPIFSVDSLLKLLEQAKEKELFIGQSNRHLFFRVGPNVFITAKLSISKAPIEEMILRATLANQDELLVDKQELIEAIKRVRVNSDPMTSAVGFSVSGDELTIQAGDSYGNLARETLDVKWGKKAREFTLHHKILLQMLETYENKICTFFLGESLKTRKSPIVLKDDNSGTVGVLQQMITDYRSK